MFWLWRDESGAMLATVTVAITETGPTAEEAYEPERAWRRKRCREILAEGAPEGGYTGYVEREAWCDWQRLPEEQKAAIRRGEETAK